MKSAGRVTRPRAAALKNSRRGSVAKESSLLCRQIRELLAGGSTLEQTAAASGLPWWKILRLAEAHQWPRKRREISTRQLRKIEAGLAAELPMRQIASRAKVGLGTVHRRKIRAGRGKVKPHRCPNGHWIDTPICLQCELEGRNRGTRSKPRLA